MSQRGAHWNLAAALLVGVAAVVAIVVVAMDRRPAASPTTVETPQGPERLAPPIPPAGELAAMAYDTFRHEVVLFGGTAFSAAGQATLNDTWTFRGRRWTKHEPTTRPGPLPGGQMVYDDQTHTCLLVWSPQGSGPAVTWSWDGSTWSRLPNVPLGGGEYLDAVASDPTSGHVLLISDLAAPDTAPATGTHTWTWDGHAWTLRHPQRPFPIVPVTGSGPTLASVGARPLDRLGLGVLAVFADGDGMQTWFWDGSTWSQRGVRAAVPYDFLSATLAEDPASQEVVLIGLGGDSGGPGSTWLWDGSAWHQGGPAPPVDSLYRGTTAVADRNSAHAIVIGDSNPDGRPNRFDELWTFNGHDWVSSGAA